MAKSTQDQSRKLSPKMFEASGDVTGLPELQSGITLSGSPAGPMTDLFGREVVLVPVSQPQEKAKGLMTLATSGRNGFGSFESVALQSCLESKLMQRLDTAGSTLWAWTWRAKATPLRRRYFQRQALERPTKGIGCTSVPISCVVSPQEGDAHRGGQGQRYLDKNHAVRLNDQVCLSNVHTPQKHDERTRGNTEADGHYFPHDLSNVAELSSVPTPQAFDSSPCQKSEEAMAKAMRGRAEPGRNGGAPANLREVVLGSVPTPMAGSPATETYNAAGNNDYSRKMVELASVRTPTERDHHPSKITGRTSELAPTIQLAHEVILATIATPRSEDSQCAGAHRGTADTLHSQTNLSSVPTPQACSPNSLRGKGQDPEKRREGGHAVNLQDTVTLYETGVDPDGLIRSQLDQLPKPAQLADSGPTATGGTPRDEKYRPIEPGIFPLAHGASNRVLKLRGYGDAICAEVAAEFVRAFE